VVSAYGRFKKAPRIATLIRPCKTLVVSRSRFETSRLFRFLGDLLLFFWPGFFAGVLVARAIDYPPQVRRFSLFPTSSIPRATRVFQIASLITSRQLWHWTVRVPPAEPNPKVASMTLKS
jgi:hypothetical protein